MSANRVDFVAEYKRKLISSRDAFALLKPNMQIVASMAAAEPQIFLGGLAGAARDVAGLTVHCANPSKEYQCFTDSTLVGCLDMRVMFLTASVRKQQGLGIVHYVPQHLSRWTANLLKEQSIDVFWGSCSVPDSRGFVSLGVGACYESEILHAAKTVILEVNPAMPATYGSTVVPWRCVDHFIESSHPLPTVGTCTSTAEDRKISEFIAELVKNGSTIQLGIGAIPNAVGKALENHRDLGVHTEMINDAMMDLYEKGVITGQRKSIWPGKIVGAFVFGSKALYEFVGMNPAVELQPASVVNDPYRIGRNFQMVSINTAVEIDLTGQVCSESIGHRELSGVGGAAETHTGAQRSQNGRGIIAVRSTASDGNTSKICFELKPGAKVSISRNDIDTVVTEYGVAELCGKSVVQRVRSLVAVAHPKFRDELLSRAKAAGYL